VTSVTNKQTNNVRLEASRKAILDHAPQGAAKLQAVKVLVLEKSKVFIGGAIFI
jgi:hypothetical protein